MEKKIFITGCAKTGTTLVRRLFNAFDLKVCNQHEITFNDFIKLDCPYQVGKRCGDGIYSVILQPHEIQWYIEQIQKYDIKIVNVTRKEADTLKSQNNYVKKPRYDACVKQMTQYPEHITCNIRYEELINNPNAVQNYVAEVLDLKIIHRWSDYPTWFENTLDDPNLKMELHKTDYSLRKIGASK